MQINIPLRHFLLAMLFLPLLMVWAPEQPLPAMGGPLREVPAPREVRTTLHGEKLALLGEKAEILQGHLAKLAEEEAKVKREEAAVRRAIVRTASSRDRTHRLALEQRLSKLRETRSAIREAREVLLGLERNEQEYALLLRESYPDAAVSVPRFFRPNVVSRPAPDQRYALAWPVPPAEGVSAGFHDASYRKRFGLEHEAIDLPVPQGTELRAAADGVVLAAHDRGYGYSTVSLAHREGLVTLYGHVSEILVEAGDRVSRGEVIARSGGRPGSHGAGLLTTGPHLHFEVVADGWAIDPLYYLPPMEVMLAAAD